MFLENLKNFFIDNHDMFEFIKPCMEDVAVIPGCERRR